MNEEIPNNDFKDWILFYGIDDENYVFDLSKHNDFINNLDEIEKARFKLALKEMLMNNTLLEHKKNKIYLLTSLGREVLESGSFSTWNPRINSELNINEKFSKNLELNRTATYITIFVAIGTMIVLIVQTYLSTRPSIIQIDKESSLTKKTEQELQKMNTILRQHYQPSKDSLKKVHHKIIKK